MSNFIKTGTWQQAKDEQRELAFLGISSKVVSGGVKLTCPDCRSFSISMNAIHNLTPKSEQFLWTCGDCNFQFGDATIGDDDE